MDSETLRKAVELVSWLESDDEGEYLQIPKTPHSAYLDEMDAPVYQYLWDALAAQLVRQVDALDEFDVVAAGKSILVRRTDNYGNKWIAGNGFAEGNDRTENTITAIVDSKVLEKNDDTG